MVELSKNFVMYKCRDVEIYRELAVVSGVSALDKGQKLAESCLLRRDARTLTQAE
jgi:hypothetical protein